PDGCARASQLKALTGLRFFPALLVVLYQFTLVSHAHIAGIVDCGFVGVSLFFVLSGFILAYNYLDRPNAHRFDRLTFWAARFARIYPVYLLAFVIAALPFFWHQYTRVSPLVTGVATLTLTQ